MAIASDAQGVVTISNPSTTIAFNVTTDASDANILMYFGWCHASATVTSVTYDLVPATQIGSGTTVNSLPLRHFYLLNSANGTNEAKFTLGSSVLQFAGANSYTGVGALDNNVVNAQTTETTTTSVLTPVADNCWHMMTVRTGTSGDSTAGSGTTQRSSGAGLIQMYDGNAAITPVASNTLTCTHISEPAASVGASFSPAVLKSVNGLAKASIKSWNGVAIANVKGVNGLSNV